MRIAVVGAGYVGLVTAACLADLGHDVTCVDVDAERVALLRRGILPIHEPQLDDLVARGLASGRLVFDDTASGTHGAALAIVCVGTLDAAGEWTDRTVRSVLRGLAADPAAPRALVVRSTLLPGTAVALADLVEAIDPGVALAVSPEFTRESTAVADFLAPDRLVVGATPRALEAWRAAHHGTDAHARIVADLEAMYAPLEARVLVTDLTSAELIKVGSNVFLAAKITFANELARIAVAAGADPHAVVDGIGLDRRIGRRFLSPGPGYGGSCLPSQARALPGVADSFGAGTPLIAGIARSNEAQVDWVAAQAAAALGGSLADRRVAVLGLTFKAGTDDLRESPALRLVRRLHVDGAEVVVHDPVATAAGVALLREQDATEAIPASSIADALVGADAVVVATEWDAYRHVDWTALAGSMRGDVVVDARGIVDGEAAEAAGLRVVGLGRRPARHLERDAVGAA